MAVLLADPSIAFDRAARSRKLLDPHFALLRLAVTFDHLSQHHVAREKSRHVGHVNPDLHAGDQLNAVEAFHVQNRHGPGVWGRPL